MSAFSPRRAGVVAALSIAAAFLLVWPVGDYVIGDDWAYTKSLEHLHTTGELRILDWNPMTLVTHLYWGLLFTKLFGFGMTLARISTVVLVLVECLALAGLLRRFGIREPAVILAVLALLFGPLHFFQAFMYSTDIPTNAWTLLALLYYVRGLASRGPDANRLLVAGSAFAGIAWSARQSAILVVAAVAAYLVLFERERLRRAGTWLACFGLPALAVAAVYGWYFGIHGPTEAHAVARQDILLQLQQLGPASAVRTAYSLAAYVALFALPLIVALPLRALRPRGKSGRIAGAVAGLLLAGGFVLVSTGDGGFPYLRNKLTAFGYLHPNELMLGARDVLWPPGLGWIAAVVLLLAATGCALLLIRGLPTVRPEDDDTLRTRGTGVRLLGLVLALQLAYSFVTFGIVFDRHLVMAAPVAIALFVTLAEARARLRLLPFAALMLPLSLYAVAGTHDVHAFSRAAFVAGEELIAEGSDPQWIEAGYAFDGWYMYERSRDELAAGRRPLVRQGDAWYLSLVTPRVLSKYVVSLSERMDEQDWRHAVSPWAASYVFLGRLDRYRPLRTHPYTSYWPPGTKQVHVLEDARIPDPQRVVDAR